MMGYVSNVMITGVIYLGGGTAVALAVGADSCRLSLLLTVIY